MKIVSAIGPEAREGDRASIRRRSSKSPTARTLEECRKREWLAQVVERWVPQARRRVDLLGFIDVVALDGAPGVLGIQTTSDSNVSARVTKIKAECREAARRWLAAGCRIQVWGYAKKGARGERKKWTLRIVEVTEIP